jgi:8-oxo-dGTP pyrophosphatase MutT (NUDIX family)
MKLQEVYNLIVENKVGRFSGAGIIFFDGEDVLLLKKPNGRWVFPGGKPIQGETPIQTARRETKEEVGKCPGEVIKEIVFHEDNRTFHSFISNIKEKFEVNISSEHTDYTWISYNKIRDLKLHKNVFKSLNKICQSLKEIK